MDIDKDGCYQFLSSHGINFFLSFLFVALDIPDIMSRVLLPEIAAIPPFAIFLSSI